MKLSRGNTMISQRGKHFGVIAILKLSTFCTTLYSTTYKGHLPSLIYYNWLEIIFFSNNAFHQCTSLSGRCHAIPFLLVPW